MKKFNETLDWNVNDCENQKDASKRTMPNCGCGIFFVQKWTLVSYYNLLVTFCSSGSISLRYDKNIKLIFKIRDCIRF